MRAVCPYKRFHPGLERPVLFRHEYYGVRSRKRTCQGNKDAGLRTGRHTHDERLSTFSSALLTARTGRLVRENFAPLRVKRAEPIFRIEVGVHW
jgi:hypothetical protein